jgi:hypothetical protein
VFGECELSVKFGERATNSRHRLPLEGLSHLYWSLAPRAELQRQRTVKGLFTQTPANPAFEA